jgi:hypothetical protein
MALTSKRYYARLWREHVAPAIREGRQPLTEIVANLPVSVAPAEGRKALYQAMARRARREIKTEEVAA